MAKRAAFANAFRISVVILFLSALVLILLLANPASETGRAWLGAATTTTEKDWCIETDGGKNFYQQGSITGSRAGNAYQYVDHCRYDRPIILEEWFCYKKKFPNNETHIIPIVYEQSCAQLNRTCRDGACVPRGS
jgi:hypothetical protein